MLKKIGCGFGILLVALLIFGFCGIRYFNNMWFKEKPVYLQFEHVEKAIHFEWAGNSYGNYHEDNNAIIIPMKIKDCSQKLYLQFDTGAPTTIIYGNALRSLIESGHPFEIDTIGKSRYVRNFHFNLGGSSFKADMVRIKENYGPILDREDSTRNHSIMSIGSDFLEQRITVIDFPNRTIHSYTEKPNWMIDLEGFQDFDFTGRRLMLPARVHGKDLELFYDSGASAFGLITSKNRYNKYSNGDYEEIRYEGKSWSSSMSIRHKGTDEKIDIGNSTLSLKRISYISKYAFFQRFLTPFTRIGGWLGNLPFTESVLIIDAIEEKFVVTSSNPSALNLAH